MRVDYVAAAIVLPSALDGRSSEPPLQGGIGPRWPAEYYPRSGQRPVWTGRRQRSASSAHCSSNEPPLIASAPGEHAEYQPYAHEIYNVLARGASDVQIARDLHLAEDSELGHPELTSRDLAPLVTQLRTIERQL